MPHCRDSFLNSESLASADVFRDRLGGHCRGSVSNHVQNTPLGEVRARLKHKLELLHVTEVQIPE